MSDTAAHAEAAPGDAHPHVLPVGLYWKIWSTLIGLTALTVAVSYGDFGKANLVVALAVATVKASLVALFFMHLKYDRRFNAVMFVGGLGFLAILIGLTMADTQFRGLADPIEAYKARNLDAPFKNGKPDTAPLDADVPMPVP
jgi:cytochrome c oxidase subunit 4